MSYEGYSQFLDEVGHYWTTDCYIEADEIKNNNCPICGKPAVWRNMVNTTNGSFDDYGDGTRIDGYKELKVKKKISGVCSCCGEEHVCEITYYIPKKKK